MIIRVIVVPLSYPSAPSVAFTCDRVMVEGSFVVMMNARRENETEPEARTLSRVYVSNSAIQWVEVEEIQE